MDDLTAWLRECLDDDERVAQAAIADHDGEAVWAVEPPDPDARFPRSRFLWLTVIDSCAPETIPPGMAEHMARWDPARVLAEIDAKRRLIDTHQPERRGVFVDLWCVHDKQPNPCDTVRLLALPYAARDGYQESWRP